MLQMYTYTLQSQAAASPWVRRRRKPWINDDPGWVGGFGFDEEGAKIDPRKRLPLKAMLRSSTRK